MNTEEIQKKREDFERQISEAKNIQEMIELKKKDNRYIEKSEIENYETTLIESCILLHEDNLIFRKYL